MAGELTSLSLDMGRGVVGPVVAPSYDIDAQAYFAAMTGLPLSHDQKRWVSDAVVE